MTNVITDNTGLPAAVQLDRAHPISSFTVRVAGASQPAGRADFVDSATTDGERIFFHTEVAKQYGGRGLGTLLVRTALADSIKTNLTVVPVCPLFAAHLAQHGDAFVADGGRWRRPRAADAKVLSRLIRTGF